MSDLRSWANTAAGNNQQPPDGWPEDQLPSTVNDCAREDMAAIRRFMERSQWIDFGHTPTYVSATSFTVAGDQTAIYTAGRRIWCEDATNLYGQILTSTYGAPNTTVTVVLDSGSLAATLVRVSVGAITPGNTSSPNIFAFSRYQTKTGTYTADITDRGSYIDVTSGTFTLTLPAANVTTGNPPFMMAIGNSGAGTLTVARAGADTIDGATSINLTQYQVVVLVSNGSNAWRRVASFGV